MVASTAVPRSSWTRAATLALAALAGCDDTGLDADGFPTRIDRKGGAFVTTLREGTVDRRAVLDLMSPVTVFDAPSDAPVVRRIAETYLIAPRSDTDTTPIQRAKLVTHVLELRPCDSASPCEIGAKRFDTDTAEVEAIEAVIGADA